MPWQSWVADVALELDEHGQFAYKLVVVTVPRQSGKTTLDGMVMTQRAMRPRARVWFTMQTQKDATDWLINEFWPLLAPLGGAVGLKRGVGKEQVSVHSSQGLIRAFPPTEDGLHSKTSDLVVVDECWAFDPEHGRAIDQAVIPTQATRPDAQVWKVSTAGTASSTWWHGTVEAARADVEAGRTDGLCYFEWSCPDDLDPVAPTSWPLYHPAYGHTIGQPAMTAALDMLGPDDFARAYGNRWVSLASRVIPVEAWRRGREEVAALPEPGRAALAFDVALDRSDATIVMAWRDAAGLAHLEVADHRDGTGWLVERLGELVERWHPAQIAYDAAGPAMDLADAATRAGLTLDGLNARQYAAACASLLDGFIADPSTVRYRPHPALDLAAASAARRALGDAWAWGRRQSSGSLAPLVAATVALWAYDHAPADIGPFRVY